MNGTRWHASTDPSPMLEHLLANHLISDRKLRLWCAAMIDLSGYPYPTIERCLEHWREGLPHEGERIPDTPIGWTNPYFDRPCDPPMAVRAEILRDLVGDPFAPVNLDRLRCGVCGGTRLYVLSSNTAVWCSDCYPAETLYIPRKRWLTPLVVNLAQAAFDGITSGTRLDPMRLLVLADALEEAGCPVEATCPRCNGTGGVEDDGDGDGWICDRTVPHPLLAHLRSDGPHFRGCWAVDLILGKE